MKKASAAKLWLFVLAGFASLAAAYFFALQAAGKAQIRDVPLATKEQRHDR